MTCCTVPDFTLHGRSLLFALCHGTLVDDDPRMILQNEMKHERRLMIFQQPSSLVWRILLGIGIMVMTVQGTMARSHNRILSDSIPALKQ